jgi:hypothetical protein
VEGDSSSISLDASDSPSSEISSYSSSAASGGVGTLFLVADGLRVDDCGWTSIGLCVLALRRALARVVGAMIGLGELCDV